LLVGTRELGRPLAVIEEALAIPSDPVLMTVGCRAPVQLPEFIMLFVNMQGFKVHWSGSAVRREDMAHPTLLHHTN
jgi:hypothetical protein